MAVNKWLKENPEKARLIQKRYYEKHKDAARRRSKIQNLKGKLAWNYLSESQKFFVMSAIKEEICSMNAGGNHE